MSDDAEKKDARVTTGEREAIRREVANEIERAERERLQRTPMGGSPVTPPPSESSEEIEEGKRLVRWKFCRERGPIFELRNELKDQQRQRERDMRKAIALATFVVALVTGGIQIWGRFTARAESNAEMVQLLKELRAEHAKQVGARAP